MDLTYIGIEQTGTVYRNLSPARLYEEAIARDEAQVADGGPLVAETGKYTGRSPDDKFVVDETSSRQDIWWGKVNRPL